MLCWRAVVVSNTLLFKVRPSTQFEDSDVKILSGVDEGAFAWLTLNYLLGKLGGSEQDTGA